MVRLNGKRPPRPQSNSYKMIAREDWDRLHKSAYDLMYSFLNDQNELDCLDDEQSRRFEEFVKQWRKHIALPIDIETWLEDRRNARANEPI